MTNQEKKDSEGFNITSVSRLDLQSIGFDTSTLTDDNMKDIADRMAESYTANNFWSDLETIAIELYKLEQHDM